MPSTYSSKYRFELPGAGEQAGLWGDTTNRNIGTLIEQAIGGYVTVSATTNPQALTALSGASDESRNMFIRLTTTLPSAFTVYVPPSSKMYFVWNNSAYTATIRNATTAGGTTPTAGDTVGIPPGARMLVVSDGVSCYAEVQYQMGGTGLSEPLTFSNTGSERMRIDAAGNLAVGYTGSGIRLGTAAVNPTNGLLLHVNNTATSAWTGAQIQFTQTALADWAVGAVPASTSFGIWYGRNTSAVGTQVLSITAAGLLTTSVADTAVATKFTATTGRIRFTPYADATYGAILDSTNTAEGAYNPLTILGGPLRLGTSALNPGIVIGGANITTDNLLSVGIGVTPSTKLDVNGTVQFRGGQTFQLLNSDNTNGYIFQSTGATGSGNARVDILQSGVGTPRIRVDNTGIVFVGATAFSSDSLDQAGVALTGGAIKQQRASGTDFNQYYLAAAQANPDASVSIPAANTYAIKTAATERLRISSSGQVNAVSQLTENNTRVFSRNSSYTNIASPITYLATNQILGPLSHGLAGTPTQFNLYAVCTSADGGYAVGDVLDVTNASTGVITCSLYANATQIGATIISVLVAAHKSTLGSYINLAASKWNLYFVAWY